VSKRAAIINESLQLAECLHDRESDTEEICSFIREKCGQELINSIAHDPS